MKKEFVKKEFVKKEFVNEELFLAKEKFLML